MKRPVIGVTPDIEFRPDGRPPRNGYFADERTFEALHESGANPIMLPHYLDAIDAYLGMIDGVYITGGGYQFRDPKLFVADGTEPPEKHRRTLFEAQLLRRAIERDMAVFAVCGGFQTLNMVTGGDLVVALKDANAEWARHRGPGYVTSGHPVRVTPGTRLADFTGTDAFEVNTIHYQGVTAAGSGAIVAAMADDGVVEAIEVPGKRFCIGTQWHPEFLISEQERRLFLGFVEASRH